MPSAYQGEHFMFFKKTAEIFNRDEIIYDSVFNLAVCTFGHRCKNIGENEKTTVVSNNIW